MGPATSLVRERQENDHGFQDGGYVRVQATYTYIIFSCVKQIPRYGGMSEMSCSGTVCISLDEDGKILGRQVGWAEDNVLQFTIH